MPDTGKWSSDKPGELVTMPTEAEVTEYIRQEAAEAEDKAERLAEMLYRRDIDRGNIAETAPWEQQMSGYIEGRIAEAREILEEIE